MTETTKPQEASLPVKRYLVSRRPDSTTIPYDGDVIMLDSRGRVEVDPSKLDEKNLPKGVSLV